MGSMSVEVRLATLRSILSRDTQNSREEDSEGKLSRWDRCMPIGKASVDESESQQRNAVILRRPSQDVMHFSYRDVSRSLF